MHERIYLIVTGAGTARRAPEIAVARAALGPRLLVVPTPNAAAVLSLHELHQALAPLPGGHGVVESYFDEKLGMPAAPGLVIVAPCGFNSLNKLAAGIADNLALSIAADAIGAGWGVLVAPAMNAGLWAHPRTRLSLELLRAWGATIVDGEIAAGSPRLASTERIVAAVRAALAG
ncbi:MAG TPA: flavoprotein [Dehalococcoidia bacterium]|nr:flavoprotein [Dehalococcoidia bacterium]